MKGSFALPVNVGTAHIPLRVAKVSVMLAPRRLAQAYIVPLALSYPNAHSLYYPRKARASSEYGLYSVEFSDQASVSRQRKWDTIWGRKPERFEV